MSNTGYDEMMFEFLEPHIGHDIKCDEWDSDGLIGVSIWCDTCGLVLSSGEKTIQAKVVKVTKTSRKMVMKCPCCNKISHIPEGRESVCLKCNLPMVNPFLVKSNNEVQVRT